MASLAYCDIVDIPYDLRTDLRRAAERRRRRFCEP
jgi:hypothetical protein